jgi:hypothetical protein
MIVRAKGGNIEETLKQLKFKYWSYLYFFDPNSNKRTWATITRNIYQMLKRTYNLAKNLGYIFENITNNIWFYQIS